MIAVLGKPINNDGRFNLAVMKFEVPVAAERRIAGGIGAGRNVRAGKFCEFICGGLPIVARTKIAAIDENVCIRAQVTTYLRQCLGVGGLHRFRIKNARPKIELPFSTVRNNMKCVNLPVAVLLQSLGDLKDRVFGRIQQYHPYIGGNTIDQGLKIFDAGIDKDNFSARMGGVCWKESVAALRIGISVSLRCNCFLHILGIRAHRCRGLGLRVIHQGNQWRRRGGV